VRAVDWSELEGAYGTDRDVPTALEIMRWADDAEDDEFSDAWLDVLCSHVWHQGTIYPITAPVLPFVFDIVDHSPALKSATCYARSEIAQFVTWCASSARRAVTSGEDDDRFNGQRVRSRNSAPIVSLQWATRSKLGVSLQQGSIRFVSDMGSA
jgi:hypothetical protein